MKGLLYKDISIMTRSFKGNILLLVALYGVLILVTREAYLAYAMTVVWGIYVASTINYDEQAHWDAYAATLPVTPGQVIGSKYLLCAASTAIGAVLSLALVFLAGVGGAEYTLGILACAEVSVLMNALLMPITYRFGAAKSRAYLMVIVFAIVFGACFVAQEILQNQTQVGIAGMNTTLQAKTALIAGIIALSLLLTAVLYAISYTICVRVYAKKGKMKNLRSAFTQGAGFVYRSIIRGGCSHRPLQNERHHIISIPRSLAERSTRSASTPRAVLWWQCSLTSAHPHGPYSSP